jgi:predicted MFS family arabinose efflux permease
LFVRHEQQHERRGRSPLVRLSLLKTPQFTAGLLTVLAFYGGNSGFFFVLAYYLQYGNHMNALSSGLGFLPIGIGFMVASLSSQWLVKRYGIKVLVTGALCMAASFVMGWAVLHNGAAEAGLLYKLTPFLLLSGIGEGLVAAPLIAIILSGVRPEEAGAASGTLLTGTQIANVTSVALIGGAYITLQHAGHQQPYLHAFLGCLGILFGLSLVTALLVSRLGRHRKAYG